MTKYREAEAAKKELKKTFPDDWIKAYKTIDRVPAADVRGERTWRKHQE